MSAEIQFGTLVDVAAREAWAHEAYAFTPWLAENLDRLGEAIGIRLELSGREVGVGRYAADIVARTAIEGEVVLIENQLERSDHTHLGQIMTYLAGTEAKIVVWVAAAFCEEHLSAIRWLNQHSHEEFSFFAVRMRVVRIGESPFAPLFEVLEKPNAWERSIQQEVRASAEPTQRALVRRAFWERYAQLYPAITDDRAAGGGSSRWHQVPGRKVIISRYKSKDEVGIFLRGTAGEDFDTLSARLAPYLPALEQHMDGSPGKFSDFAKVGPPATDDPGSWDAAIHWLEEKTRQWRAAIEAVLPEETVNGQTPAQS